jgi:hypothetical protein
MKNKDKNIHDVIISTWDDMGAKNYNSTPLYLSVIDGSDWLI